ncbi:histidine-type phosphatase [Paenibacillus taichungensis]|uniref:Multiple inositol polyphosphate phosphatase 1 n=1 Tax=Paenibacillus taichungensis TaxID=484184 RepID=A0A329QRN8_9BACL|nr:copper amine oxidase N-terminal domain-containing protein [Paenibacillus taichungensis]RAW15024.1 histidine-type phosphatase [Paenibacillus taichungensis]
MKKIKKIVISVASLALLTSVVVIDVYGAGSKRTIEVSQQSVNVIVDGQKMEGESFLYNGVTYVPARTIGEALGKEVGWDENTRSVFVGQQVNDDQGYRGTKTPYPFVETTYTSVPEGYKPVFINYVGRHGSRHLSSSKYDKTLMELLQIAEKDGQITDSGKELKNQIGKLMEVEKDHYGLLSTLGEEELNGIGVRLGQNFKDVFSPDKKIIAQATYKDRTPQSRDNFLEGLQESLGDKKWDIRTSTFEEEKDPYLRPYDIATKYNEYVEDGEWVKLFEDYASQETGTRYAKELLLQFVSQSFYDRLEAGEFKLKDEQGKVKLSNPTEAASNLYELYIISSNLKEEGNFEFGKYFSTNQLKWYESIDNINDFYEKGPSLTSTDVPQNIVAPLVKELIHSTDQSLSDGDTAGVFRFAHAETMIPLSSFLDIKGANVSVDKPEEVSENWDGSEISPMGANIQWILYSNGKDHLIKMLRNEEEIAFPIETKTYPYYKWEDVKAYYQNKLNSIGVDMESSLGDNIKLLQDEF